MDKIKQLGYLTIGVADLDEGIEFYSRIARLALVERRGGTAFMSGGLEHHWLRLEECSTPGAQRVAFEAVDEAALGEIRRDLAAQHIEFTEGGDMDADKVQRWLRFVDPAGVDVELFLDMQQCPVAPPSPGVALEKFLHAGFEVPNYDANFAFYTGTLGFKASDFIGNAVSFLRCGDGYHHSMVMIRSPHKPTLNHFCIQVASLDDVMRFRHNAVRHGAPLRDDLLRHAPSGSIGVYVKDEARGFAVEYCYGHPQLGDDHRPRILPMALETVDVWRAPLADLLPASAPAPAASNGSAHAADPEAGGRSPAFEHLAELR